MPRLVETDRSEIEISADLQGRWLRVDYAMSLLAPLSRPLARWRMEDGSTQSCPMPAPLFGRATWIVRAPMQARALSFEGTALRVDRIVRLSWFAVLRRAARARPMLVMLAMAAATRGARRLAEMRLNAALNATPIRHYRRWRAAGARRPEWSGLDAPPAHGPHLRFLAVGDRASDVEAQLRGSFAKQPWTNWSCRRLDAATKIAAACCDLADDDLVSILRTPTRWRSEALAMAAAAASAQVDLLYGDEEGEGLRATPRLKPDWGPICAQSLDLPGRAWFARVGWLRAAHGDRRLDEIGSPRPPDGRVRHVRRVWARCAPAPALVSPPQPPRPAKDRPIASLVIPTRDRVELLSACLASVAPLGDRVELVIVDNDSSAPDALAYLAKLESQAQVLRRPGPFNFSALSNAGARLARASTLVFLNNDVEALDADWLELMVGWAERPEFGAIGAKLLYPDRSVQHAGIALGVGGWAAHVERGLSRHDAGYFGRLEAPHEVSAATGACLAVARDKFFAVGGFDETHLPVDLNDVDLCLRLAERGWRTLMEPRAVLLHHESATREPDAGRDRHRAERALFLERWGDRLYDDPYFHPALSLTGAAPRLG